MTDTIIEVKKNEELSKAEVTVVDEKEALALELLKAENVYRTVCSLMGLHHSVYTHIKNQNDFTRVHGGPIYTGTDYERQQAAREYDVYQIKQLLREPRIRSLVVDKVCKECSIPDNYKLLALQEMAYKCDDHFAKAREKAVREGVGRVMAQRAGEHMARMNKRYYEALEAHYAQDEAKKKAERAAHREIRRLRRQQCGSLFKRISNFLLGRDSRAS